MDIDLMIAKLRQELALLDQAIQVLKRISDGQGRRRGRPPKWLAKQRQHELTVREE